LRPGLCTDPLEVPGWLRDAGKLVRAELSGVAERGTMSPRGELPAVPSRRIEPAGE